MGLTAAITWLVGSVAAVIVTVLISATSRLVADDLNAWAPRITKRLVERAVRRAPPELQGQFAEEWAADITDTPGTLSKLIRALSLNIASARLTPANNYLHEMGEMLERSAIRDRKLNPRWAVRVLATLFSSLTGIAMTWASWTSARDLWVVQPFVLTFLLGVVTSLVGCGAWVAWRLMSRQQ